MKEPSAGAALRSCPDPSVSEARRAGQAAFRLSAGTPDWAARGWRLAAVLLGVGLVPGQALADFRAAQEAESRGDWGRVFKVCKTAADAGERNCQYYIGHVYGHGLGVPRNPTLSQAYLRKCAAQGQLDCEEALGPGYRGRPGAVDPASKWSLRSSPLAATTAAAAPVAAPETAAATALTAERLGEIYRGGLGAWREATQAVAMVRKAVEDGLRTSPEAVSCQLAGVSLHARGVAVDWNEVASWAEHGPRAGWQDCGKFLAAAVAQGARSLAPERERALELAQRAYEEGAPAAANALGVFFRDGVGAPVDLARAVRYFVQARDKGEANAWVHLGRLHLEGRGVARDPGKAHGYFLSAQANLDKLSAANRRFIEDYFSRARPPSRPQALVAQPRQRPA